MQRWQESRARRFFCLLGLLFGLACSREQAPGVVPTEEEVPIQITADFTTTESDSGVVRFVFRAKIARSYADGVTRAENIEVDFYEDGERVSVLTALRGILQSGKMTAEGDVVVVALEDSTVLETEKLYWDNEKGKIRTDEAFRITENGDVLKGTGLTTDPDLEMVDIERPEITIQNPEIR